MFQSHLPTHFWSYAIKHVVHLINRVPSPINGNKTPFELLFKQSPDFTMLKFFGCLCYASTNVSHRHKFDPRARRGIFLGHQIGIKGYVIFYFDTKEFFVSRNVLFDEMTFPFKNPSQTSPPTLSLLHGPITSLADPFSIEPMTLPLAHRYHPAADQPIHHTIHSPSTSHSTTPSLPFETPSPSPSLNPTPQFPPRRQSQCETRPHAHLVDYFCNSFLLEPTSSSSKCSHPLSSVLSYIRFSSPHLHYLMSLSTDFEPSSYQEAKHHVCWQEAMKAEVEALELNHTWTIVNVPPNVKPIGCKWVYKIKRHPDGSVERYKAHLVAKSFAQTEGMDYFETFSPIVKMATVRVVLALASIHRWTIQQLDVNNAFLYGDLSEDVYMTVPSGVSVSGTPKCCKLHKSLYGLKQSSIKWYEKLSILLLSCGYQQAQTDHSLFVKTADSSFTALIVYVDDIILTGNSSNEMAYIKHVLHSNSRIKDLGILKYFVGIKVAHLETDIYLCQHKYCLDL